ncbi:MAG: DUF3786 domain-containing protein [Armatimonadota bacterium]
MPEQPFPVPPRQQPYLIAFELGFDHLLHSPPSDEALLSRGACWEEARIIRLPALNEQLLIDIPAREVRVEGAGKARIAWTLLALHYLASGDAPLDIREVSMRHFSDSRTYLSVFEKRIIGRFLATAGRTRERFTEFGERYGKLRPEGPGLAYTFPVFPRLPITIIRYEGDEEFGPEATIIYRADAEHLLPPEDRIVAAELLLDLFVGKGIAE